MQNRTVFLALATVLAAAEAPPRMPIPNNYQDSILTKWLAKPVLESKLLDDAESLETWSLENVGQAKGQMTLTAERKISGANALRLRCAMVGDTATAGRYYGTVVGPARGCRRGLVGVESPLVLGLCGFARRPRGLSHRHVPQRGQGARARQLRQDGRELRHPQESRMEPHRLGDRQPAARQGDGPRLLLPHAGPRTRRRGHGHIRFRQTRVAEGRCRPLRRVGRRSRRDLVQPLGLSDRRRPSRPSPAICARRNSNWSTRGPGAPCSRKR